MDYLTALRDLHDNAQATDELSLRDALSNLFKQTADRLERPVQFIGEGKKVAVGKPDFTVTSAKGLPLGYVEAEAYGVDLDKLTGHAKEQNDRFRANLDNFLLTNHLEFRLYVGGALVDSAKLSAPPDKGAVNVSEADANTLRNLLDRFLRTEPVSIASPRELARHLARRTRLMCDEARAALAAGSPDLHGWFEAFRQTLLHDLTADQFADMYAQTLAYGLFAARCQHTGGVFTRKAAADLIPKTNPFLRSLFRHIEADELDERIAWIVEDMAHLLAHADMEKILSDIGKRTGREDPIVHFYETFLAVYDRALREVRGVYYTPEPVVSYIVRSIDHLLKTRFHKPLGLADEKTLILDPATGTGSFLFAVVNHVHETVRKTVGTSAWGGKDGYVEKNLLPRLFGFELLVAPYAVAHLKLGLLLQETGYHFASDQRVGIYLTNTLEEAIKISGHLPGLVEISKENNAAADIKENQAILVVLGNPPYSGHSANRSRDEKGKLTFIGELIEDYKQVDGKPLGEKNPKWLQDDYVKFIRFAQWRIEKTGEGVIGYITNHGYLDNPTFRGMRQHLMRTFNEIYVYNLHGNAKKKERAPDGGKDENVFDIQQGVALLLCVKQKGNTQPARVYHADLWGVREVYEETPDGQRLVGGKYHCLWENSVATTQWTELQPSPPFYLFVPQNTDLLMEYEQGWKVTDIFPVNGWGIATRKDYLLVDFERESLVAKFTDILRLTVEEAIAKYGIRKSPHWSFADAKPKLSPHVDETVRPVLFRPFDIRYVYYDRVMIERGDHRYPLMHHMLYSNLALITVRRVEVNAGFDHILCTGGLSVLHTVSMKEGNFVFPLFLYPNASGLGFDAARRPNLSPAFLKALAEKLNLPQTAPHGLPQGITPEDIFHYAYAVFHSPTYRERYAEFLKMDFPRLPLTSDVELFCDLAALGKQLVALHLLDTQTAPVLYNTFSLFEGEGNREVEKVRYVDTSQRVYINKTQYFDNVPPEVWEFHIGGYQVCDKWLKDRKGRRLTIDDIQRYQRIVVALRETIRLMAEIDERIPGFPMS